MAHFVDLPFQASSRHVMAVYRRGFELKVPMFEDRTFSKMAFGHMICDQEMGFWCEGGAEREGARLCSGRTLPVLNGI